MPSETVTLTIRARKPVRLRALVYVCLDYLGIRLPFGFLVKVV
ncbi:hypothetical protein METEAL_15410 [Mesoterricola silvestris]|uniref:Uncharacterized protein n=1 Tax=Mesoterricola silvestris TaxID=2927979 RepID=A0AA48K9I6_9BACT|nr:hypothetical protein METEAL_15410 [Mesoterricola silvestris]